MTISSTYSPDIYAGDGSTDTFAVTFPFLSVSTNVKVSIKVDSTGVLTLKTASTHYNVSGSNVVFTAGNIPASGESILIELNPDYTQDSDYTENSSFPAETLETDLDERCLESQLNSNLSDSALKVDSATAANVTSTTIVASSTALTNADKYIKFNDTGTGFEVRSLSASAGLGNLSDDDTPQLGGDLDLNGYNIDFPSTANISDCLDEDNMASDSATSLATQQSIKAYVDANVGSSLLSADLDANGYNIQFDDATGIEDDSGNQQITFGKTASAVNELKVTNAATGNSPKIEATGDDTNVGIDIDSKGTGTIAIGSADSVVTLDGTSVSGTLVKDEDDMTSDSATHLATQQSIKAYVQANAGGALVQLATASASASATVDFTSDIDGTYSTYLVVGTNIVPATSDRNMHFRVGTGVTPTWQTSTYDWIQTYKNKSSTNARGTENDGEIELFFPGGSGGVNNSSVMGASFHMYVYNPANTATVTRIQCEFGAKRTDNLNALASIGGGWYTTTAVTALRFYMDSGNITSGEFTLYGIT